ncbi:MULTISPECIES: aminotransferase class I/II-fold pyridoxal phosphate-dependent enzyme [unclassified Legionella]|uniref:aminotransferase class I/II-fold pyridoxal phosphate-dependent enzyme n=1 Tax=unclassified Legionella TaxID=2622702 RepID=UPI0013EF890E|nr:MULTISPECIES: aminotransferase class I/II-fold pyridoxal phosphate-dependent enzyme [unclassified Legionella]MDI9819336.1 aminotransferase class I/II-fold pyridoxal phosphate-dependent enzyme [Legionella sp. PL877]
MAMNKLTFPYQFLQNVISNPDKIAITFLNEKKEAIDISYSELMKKINGVGNAILESTHNGAPVLLLYTPGINFIVAFLACLYTNRLAIPAYPPINFSAVSRLESIIRNSNPALILSEETILKNLKKIPLIKYLLLPYIKKKVLRAFHVPDNIVFLFESVSQMMATDSLSDDQANFDVAKIEGPAFIQYTSGTTSNPKGVLISHSNIADNLHLIREAFNIHSESKGFIWLPPYHDMGLIGGILVPLYHCIPVVLTSPLNFIKNPNLWLESISKYRATISGGPNFAYNLCNRRTSDEYLERLDLSSWEIAFCGAEPINAETMNHFVRKFKACGFKPTALIPCYGNAESTLIVSSTNYNEHLNVVKINRDSLSNGQVVFDSSHNSVSVVDCGMPLLNVKIASTETGEFLQEKQIGEILINGNSVSSGYWNDQQKTDAAFKVAPDGNRYYHSGDLGFLSEGKLFISGRMNDLIIIGGRNYFAHEIESIVHVCSPDIRQGCCVAYESFESGISQLALAIEVKSGKEDHYPDLVRHIMLEVNQYFGISVAEIKLLKPHSILKTTSGKLQRYQTVKHIETHPECVLFHFNNHLPQDGRAEVPVKPAPEHKKCHYEGKKRAKLIERTIIELVNANYSQLLKCKPNTSLERLGLDSIMYIKLLSSLKQRLSLEFEVNDIVVNKNQTIRTLAKEIARLTQESKRITRLEQLPKIKNLLERHSDLVEKNYHQLFMRAFEGPANSIISLDGKPFINFASYNYLGLSDDKEMKQFIKDNVDRYGSSASASRLVAGNRVLTERLEQELAQFVGYPDAILFTAGYQTVVSTITHLFGHNDAIIYDELVHNSSLLGAYYSGAELYTFKHNDPESLHNQLALLANKFEKILIITEGVFSMDGDIAPIDKIIALKKEYGCFLMIDEAHSLGVIGNTGRGVIEYFQQSPEDIDIIIGTLSKAFSSCGGFVCASRELIQYMKFSAPGFVFSAGITPANAAAALYALQRIKKEPQLIQRMQHNADYFLKQANTLGLDTGESRNTPIVPVIIKDSNKTLEASYQLFCEGIYAPPIIAPGVTEEQARIRFFITALHQKEQLDFCIEELARIKPTLLQ